MGKERGENDENELIMCCVKDLKRIRSEKHRLILQSLLELLSIEESE